VGPLSDSACPRGKDGEDAACAYLASRGLTVIERNFRCRGGEIDIVARDGESTVFVEVRQRSSESHGAGVETVTGAKRKRIIHAARLYAAAKGLTETPIRFDVVSLDGGGRSSWLVRHDRDAFDGTGR
jgi:putative endonuclease